MRVLASLALLTCACASQRPLPPGAEVELTTAELEAEAASLRELRLPPDLVLRAPYAPPYSARSLIVPSAWYRAAPAAVAPRALASDLRILERLLRLAYVGEDRAAGRGLDWRAFFEGWRAQLAADPRAAVPLADAFAPLERWRLALADPVSGPPGPPVDLRSHVALLPGPVMGPCDRAELASGGERALLASDPAQHPRVVRISREDGRRLEGAVYLSLPFAITRVRCSRGWVPATPVEAAAAAPHEAVFRPLDDAVAYLRLPGLDEDRAAAYAGLRRQVEAWAPGARALVVDLRGAGGDHPEVALPLLAPYLGVDFAPPRPAVASVGSCLAAALRWGTLRRDGGSLQQAAGAVREASAAPCDAPTSREEGTWSHASRRFDRTARGPLLLVVVDADCRSGCEALAYTLGASPRTVLAGVNTRGEMAFGDPGTLVLPATHVPFRLATRLLDPWGDGRSVDGYGLDVDVLLATAEAGSDAALRELAYALTR